MKVITWILVILLLAGAGYYGYSNYWASSEVAVSNPENSKMVYWEGVPQTQKDIFLEEQGELLLNADYIENHTDAHFYWESNEDTLVVNTLETVFRLMPGEGYYMENGQPVDLAVPMQRINNQFYLPVSFVEPILKINWIYREQNQTLILEERRDCRLIAEVIVEGAAIRQDQSIKAPLYNVPLAPGDQLVVYETHEKWLKVRTENGIIGFIHKKYVKRYEECRPGQRPASGRI